MYSKDFCNIYNEYGWDYFSITMGNAILKYFEIKPYLVTLCPIDSIKYKLKYELDSSVDDIILIHKRINKVIKELASKYEIELIDDNKTISKKS